MVMPVGFATERIASCRCITGDTTYLVFREKKMIALAFVEDVTSDCTSAFWHEKSETEQLEIGGLK